MTAPSFVTIAAVREYLNLNTSSTDSRYTDSSLGSNIRAASEYIQRWTHRQFADQTGVEKTFSTEGRSYIALPGLRSATTVTLGGSSLSEGETFYLLPDAQQTGLYTGIQFRPFGSGSNWWRAVPEWFDRNLDSPYHPSNYYGGGYGTVPNDLVIDGDWGFADEDIPESLMFATKALASYFTKRPDALLSGIIATPEGGTFDLSFLPVEVIKFVEDWKIGEAAVSV